MRPAPFASVSRTDAFAPAGITTLLPDINGSLNEARNTCPSVFLDESIESIILTAAVAPAGTVSGAGSCALLGTSAVATGAPVGPGCATGSRLSRTRGGG